METNSIIITVIAVAVVATLLLTIFSGDKTLTISIELQEEEEKKVDETPQSPEIKPKRTYKKRKPAVKTDTAVKSKKVKPIN